jgi:hypothetical protein
MPGLGPGIHEFGQSAIKDVDGRAKPGHDAQNEKVLKRWGDSPPFRFSAPSNWPTDVT